MKLGPVELPALAVPRLGLAAFRRRIVFHGAFVLLALATLALAITLLAEEKQRSRQRYEQGLKKTLAEITAQLRHPAGQLALLNPRDDKTPLTPLSPMLLPLSAIDFDDPVKSQQAAELTGCAVRYGPDASLCVAVGNRAAAGGFIYLVGSLVMATPQARERGALELPSVHRLRLTVQGRGRSEPWIAPFELAGDGAQFAGGRLRGRLTGFAGHNELLDARAKPDRDFRGWLWQEAECLNASESAPDCQRRTFYSVRLPVEFFRDALFQRPAPAWPPADLSRITVRAEWLAPGSDQPLFDSNAATAATPFSLRDVAASLAAAETLRIDSAGTNVRTAAPLATLRGRDDERELASPWLNRLIQQLPPQGAADVVELKAPLTTASGTYQLTLRGDLRAIDRALSATATRLSWFVGAMLAAIALAWLVIEVGLVRRVAVLTQRAAAVSHNMQDPQVDQRIGELDVSDLRGSDELGILARTLAELLQRVKDNVRREHIRAEQERDMWHAVGHEIMSPLQSLMVLHGRADDASHRYVQRMQQAVRVLYGTASPSEALASASLQLQALDLNEFLLNVASNARFAGIDAVQTPSPMCCAMHSATGCRAAPSA
jgi:two-component system, OmpR family, sensor kinase